MAVEGAPEIDYGPLLVRDRTYREYVDREQRLRAQLERLAGGSGTAWAAGPTTVVEEITEAG